jgi:hypothetical protein
MPNYARIVWFLLLTVILIIVMLWFTRGSRAPGVSNPNTETPIQVPVNIFFGTSRVLSSFELRSNALVALRGNGIFISTNYSCAINVSLNALKPECIVLFSEGLRSQYHVVVFGSNGAATRVSTYEPISGFIPSFPTNPTQTVEHLDYLRREATKIFDEGVMERR